MDTRDEFMSAIHSSPGETLDNWVVPDWWNWFLLLMYRSIDSTYITTLEYEQWMNLLVQCFLSLNLFYLPGYYR
jgi:hypothetical protein